jgi:hypothetical protein
VSAPPGTDPIIAVDRLIKASMAPPLRVRRLVVAARDRFVLAGLDRGPPKYRAPVTGAAVPTKDGGSGPRARDIATDAECMRSTGSAS